MKIAILQDYLRRGGTEAQSVELQRRWTEEGCEVHLIRYRPGGALEGRAGNLRGRVLQRFDSGLNWWAPGLSGVLRQFQPAAVVMMGRNGHRYSRTVREALPSATLLATLRTRRKLPGSYRAALRRATWVVANSEAGRRRLEQEAAVEQEKIAVIPNGLLRLPPAPEVRARQREELRATHGFGPEVRLLLCLGSMVPGKRTPWVVDTLSALQGEWRLCFVGEGPDQGTIAVRARQLRVADRVVLAGAVDDPSPWLAAADCVVSGSVEEGLPNALIEAQAWGAPVVAVEVEGVAETLLPGTTGAVVLRDDRAGFRAAVDTWSSRRERVAPVASTRALALFDPAVRAREMLDLLSRDRKGSSP